MYVGVTKKLKFKKGIATVKMLKYTIVSSANRYDNMSYDISVG